MHGRKCIIVAAFALAACNRHDTASIESQVLHLSGDDPGYAQMEALDALDEQKAMWLERYNSRASNCHQLTPAGIERMNMIVQPGDHYRGETPEGKPLVDHAHCIDKPHVIPIDDPQFGNPMAVTVSDAIKQQQKIEDTFKGAEGDRRFGLGDGHDDHAVSCSDQGDKVACTEAD